MFASILRQSTAAPTFSGHHKKYVKELYRRFLRDAQNWNVQRNLWRRETRRIRAEFEHNRNVRNPRELAGILEAAEEKLASHQHPDPYKRKSFPLAVLTASPNVCQREQVVRFYL